MRIMLLLVLSILGVYRTAAEEKGPPTDNIINGQDTTSAPYQARVSIFLGSSASFCGGVVMSASWVLTAAHCCDSTSQAGQSVSSTYEVTAGTSLRTSGGTTVTADQVYIHPSWDSTDYASEQGFDLCLLHLSTPFPLSSALAAIAIAAANPAAGTQVRVTGWGSTSAYSAGSSSAATLSETLQEAFVTVLSAATVDAWFTASGANYGCNPGQDVAGVYNYNGVLATGDSTTPVQDACQGDSGGPLVTGSSGSYTLVGTVSHGYGCGQLEIPSFQASVVNSKSWVESVIAGSLSGSLCNSRTCGPGAQCVSGSCSCKTGYSLGLGSSDLFGFTCRRWLNGGQIQKVSGFNTMYELYPASSVWDASIIRGFGAPPPVSSQVTYCGYNFFPYTSSEAQTVTNQINAYIASAGLGSAPNNAVWTSIKENNGNYLAFLSPSTATSLSATMWASGEPSGGTCAMMGLSGGTAAQWDAVSCDTQNWYLVKYITLNSVSEAESSSGAAQRPCSWLLPFLSAAASLFVLL